MKLKVENNIIKAIGYKYFLANDDESGNTVIQYRTIDEKELIEMLRTKDSEAIELYKEDHWHDDLYDLIKGSAFLNSVHNLGFTNYDGHIDCVYVDGYKTNLGLASTQRDFIDGKFLIGDDLWKWLCYNHEVYVNWINK